MFCTQSISCKTQRCTKLSRLDPNGRRIYGQGLINLKAQHCLADGARQLPRPQPPSSTGRVQTRRATLAISRVYLDGVHSPAVPTLKMAVWLRFARLTPRSSIPGETPEARRPRPAVPKARGGLQTVAVSCFHQIITTRPCVTVTEMEGQDFNFGRLTPAPGLFLATTLRTDPFRRTVT